MATFEERLNARDLLEVVKRERRFGVVRLNVVPLPNAIPPAEASNLVVRETSLIPPDNYWVSLPAKAARLHLVRCLHHDLSYGAECMPKVRAEQLGDRFLSLFDEIGRQYFTNTLPWLPCVYERAKNAPESGILVIADDEVTELGWGRRDGDWTCTGLTKSGFDTGLVVVDPYRAGILWFEDED